MYLPFRASWQTVIRPSTSFPLPPSKIPYGGFSPVRLQAGCQQRPSSPGGGFDAATVEISAARVVSRSRTDVRRHSRLLTPPTRPVALGSASGYAVRQPHRLLWPHPSFCSPRLVYGLCQRRCDQQKVPNLLWQSLIPCRCPYSDGSRPPIDEFAVLAGPWPLGVRRFFKGR